MKLFAVLAQGGVVLFALYLCVHVVAVLAGIVLGAFI
jgi:hypothetical protein